MGIEDINADLNVATGHLRTAQDAGSTAENITHTIWETVDGLVANPGYLYLIEPPPPGLMGANRMVTSQDITTTVDTAATGYSEACAELSETTRGVDNDHINYALAHLHNAVDLLHGGDMDATTQAKVIEGNVEKLGEGVIAIVRLLLKINGIAYRLESSAHSSVRHSRMSIEAIEGYQETI